MKKKEKIIILIITLLVILTSFFLYFVFLRHKETLSIAEKQWIDNNKNDVIDISVLNNIPAFTYNGNGVIFDFLNYVSKETNLSFNPSSYKLSDTDLNDYSFMLKNKKEKNDLLIYQDNYILINSDGSIVNDINAIDNLKIGILKEDEEKFKTYFNETNQFIVFDDIDSLLNNSETNAIITLKTQAMQYLNTKDLNISYQFLGETKDYVLSLNGDDNLNSILKKYFNKWYEKEYNDSYNEHLLNDYFEFDDVSTLQQTNLKSKSYVYGFVDNGIYDKLTKGKLTGLNNAILKSFADFSGISIEYKKYSNISKMIKDYENGKIDIMLNDNNKKLKKDSYYTKASIESQIVVLSNYNKNVFVNSIQGLKPYKVSVVKNSKIEKLLSENNVKYKTYKNLNDLLKNLNNDSIVVVDFNNYNFYKTRQLKNYKVDAILDDISYNFVVNNSDSNATFTSLFDFYVSYNSSNKLINDNYEDFAYTTVDYFYVMLIVIIIIFILLVISIGNKIRLSIAKYKKNHRSTLTKEEKLKYIDQLTSLKNRAYLNSKVEKWDDSEVYPQCIIVVDLNNIAYINDNYGREEGDKIILQAANILITSQLPNTEIIRTDGNEFLIYLVGYPEKTVIAYLRKLNRAFKSLDHGFGAASGYSMIMDGIKTFDDAVNEATIDMRNNKDGN